MKGNLPDTEQKVREAAMWAAANQGEFDEASGRAYRNCGTLPDASRIHAERQR